MKLILNYDDRNDGADALTADVLGARIRYNDRRASAVEHDKLDHSSFL